MNDSTPDPRKTRIVQVPQPEGVTPPPAIISVELAEDEDVEWHWTHTPEGKSVITGYTIIPRHRSGEEPPDSVA